MGICYPITATWFFGWGGRGRVVRGRGERGEVSPNLSPDTRHLRSRRDKTATSRAPGALNLPGLASGLGAESWVPWSCSCGTLLPALLHVASGNPIESGAVAPGRRHAPLRWCLLRARWCRLQHTATEHEERSFSRHWTCLTSPCRTRPRLTHQEYMLELYNKFATDRTFHAIRQHHQEFQEWG